MSFIVQKPGAGAVAIDDLGITVTGIASSTRDLRDIDPSDIAQSVDLATAIAGGILVVLDPRDDTTALSIADGEIARSNANDTHFGVSGGRLAGIDAPGSVVTNDYILQYNSTGDIFEAIAPGTLITANTENIEDIFGALGINGTDTTFTYNDVAGTVEWSVNDAFLRNNGDTLDSGTLTIASGASLAVATGGSITIADAPTSGTDAVNKDYVDGVAQGLDTKESVQVATTIALTIGAGVGEWAYANNGGVGDTLTNNTASTTDVDTVTLSDGYRVLIKDQVDTTQNGIYTVSGAAVGNATILTRATDQDGSPANEVSAGNFTFVEGGTQSSTGWVVMGIGTLTLNTDNIDWTQFSESSAYTGSSGVLLTANDFSMHIESLTVDLITTADELAFNDTSEPNVTNKITVANFLADLDVVNGITGNGIIVRTAADTYTNRTIAVDGAGALDGLAIANADGVLGNPTVGLDIQNLPIQTAIDITDRVAVWDSTANANVYYTVGDVAGALPTVNSFETWTAGGNSTGDPSMVADSATDVATISGGIGINIDVTAATDILSISNDKSRNGRYAHYWC